MSNGHWAVFLLQGLEPSLFSAETGRSLSKHFREVSEPDNVFPVLVIHQDHGAVQVLSIPPKLSKTWKQHQMEQKFPREVLETVEFAKCEPFKRNSWISGRKVEWTENFQENITENLGKPGKAVLFFGNFRKCSYIRYWKLPKIQTGWFGWMENAP